MTTTTKRIPDSLRAAIGRLGDELDRNGLRQRTVDSVASGLAVVPPEIVVEAANEIQHTARLYRGRRRRTVLFWRAVDPFPSLPGLELVYLFHADGHLRETALDRIQSGLPSAFVVAAIAYRLNDWVPQVRRAALRCAERTFPLTEPAIVARAALFLLGRRHEWRRWDNEARAIDAVLARPDVVDALTGTIATSANGPMARILRQVLRQPHMDRHLPMLAAQARQPAVRAAAAQALIEGRVRWITGSEKKWIDKSLGRYRRGPVFAERNISSSTPLESAVETAARDRSAAVRRIAASGLIRNREHLANLDAVAAMLADDRSRAVRARIEFLRAR